MGQKYQRQNGESLPAFRERVGAAESAERQTRESLGYRHKRFKQQERALRRDREADRVDGFDRDDLGESPDY